MAASGDPVRAALEIAFGTRDASALARVLGFDGPALPLPGLLAELPALARAGVLRIRTHGARGPLVCYELLGDASLSGARLAQCARALRNHNLAQFQLYLFALADFARIVIASYGISEELRSVTLEPARMHAADLDAVRELVPAGEVGSALAARHDRALDRTRVTRRFFADFTAQRDRVARAWQGPPPQARRAREQLALLLLSRLMFLYFLQHRGHLGGDASYLVRRLRAVRGPRSFYAAALVPLFFSVLNRRPGRRPPRARDFGELPYLNGGLFERHPLERKYRRLDLADDVVTHVFDDLLERYRFTAYESADAHLEGVHDLGVDPEMLGRVFEGLMLAHVRTATGTYYTPAATVDRLTSAALRAHLAPRFGEAAAAALATDGAVAAMPAQLRSRLAGHLAGLRILDPACGSGAFLLGALSRVARLRACAEDRDQLMVRRDIVARSLYGVDLQSDAALLCALRLWLALVPADACQPVQPLPNLDRQVRQGDSLVDPLDLRAGTASSSVRSVAAELGPAAAAYVTSEPEQRPALLRTLARAEQRLAAAWAGSQRRRLDREVAELRARAAQRDLFGELTADARAARAGIPVAQQRAVQLRALVRAVRRRSERPFFSFGVHFPQAALAGFDIVLCNPPWVRSHNWPAHLKRMVRHRFDVCRTNDWQPPGSAASRAGGSQVDLALLFLERSLELLAPGGVLGIILPAKFMRSLSGAAARRLLLERTDIISIEDHSLDQRSIFEADAFAAVIVARKREPGAPATTGSIDVTAVRRGAPPARYALAQRDLSFDGDPRAPWLIVPPDVRRVLQHMREAPPLGAYAGLRVRRGVVTGANHVLLLSSAERRLAGLTLIRSEGHATAAVRDTFEGVVESAAVTPLIRGCDVAAWRCRRERHLLRRVRGARPSQRHLAAYLAKHSLTLADLPMVEAAPCIVAWHDLAETLNAVVADAGAVALNTVYFIALPAEHAHLLCAYFNARPCRVFARAVAERAKDARFRFLAWTMALLPLPPHWRTFEHARLRALSERAHAAGALAPADQAELDAIVARAYSLSSSEQRALAAFDDWLRGQ